MPVAIGYAETSRFYERHARTSCPNFDTWYTTTRYRPGNNEKNHVRHHVKVRPLDDLKSVRFFWAFLFSYRFGVNFFVSFDTCYITKHLFTETSGNSEFCGPSTARCCPRRSLGQQRRSRGHKTHCFPRSHNLVCFCKVCKDEHIL